ncbi:hypothetical protein EV2_023539 [Malus domestica]
MMIERKQVVVAMAALLLLFNQTGLHTLIFTEPSCIADLLKELSTSRILHHNTKLCRSQNYLSELNDVWMTKRSVVYDFPCHILINLVAAVDVFGGDKLFGLFVPHKPGHPKIPRSNILDNLVLFHFLCLISSTFALGVNE